MGDLHVTGGVGGTAARFEDLDHLAAATARLGEELAEESLRLHALLFDVDLLTSAVLDPVGFAGIEGALLRVLDGSGGLSVVGLDYAGTGRALGLVVAAYRAVEAAQTAAVDGLRWSEGFGVVAPLGVLAVGALRDPQLLADVEAEWLGQLFGGGSFDWQRILTEHPGLVDDLVGMSPGLLSRLGVPTGTAGQGAGRLGRLYPDGDGVPTVTAQGFEGPVPAVERRPDGTRRGPVERLLAGLDHRNRSAHGATQGEVDVRAVRQPDGSSVFVVTVPGTKDWQPIPLQDNRFANDLATNLHAMAGQVTEVERGLGVALAAAGAPPGAPVLLVGHSQGGIVAMNAAAHSGPGGSFPYAVTHVVTVGSPVARIAVPTSVQVLSLENECDLVPHLDAAASPDEVNRTTVTFRAQRGSIGANHGIDTAYLPVGAELDRSDSPSVRRFIASAAPYLDGSSGSGGPGSGGSGGPGSGGLGGPGSGGSGGAGEHEAGAEAGGRTAVFRITRR